MSQKTPLVSIGLNVYNGANFLARAIESILAQTFTDFELIISDNASTDNTGAIAESYAAKDSRIRYYRAPKNMGAGWNTRRVYELATGKYYKWAAHDDIILPTFLERTVAVLENDPTVSIAHVKTRVVDEHNHFIEDYIWPMRTDLPGALDRFRGLLLHDHLCFQIYGLMRRSALESFPPQGSYVNSDGILLGRMGLLGSIIEIPEVLFVSTRHSNQSTRVAPTRVQKSDRFRLTKRHGTLPGPEWWDPEKSRSISFPEWRQLQEWFLSVQMSPLRGWTRLRAYALLLPWIYRHFRRMMKDLLIAADQVIYNFQTAKLHAAKQQLAEQTTQGD